MEFDKYVVAMRKEVEILATYPVQFCAFCLSVAIAVGAIMANIGA